MELELCDRVNSLPGSLYVVLCNSENDQTNSMDLFGITEGNGVVGVKLLQ